MSHSRLTALKFLSFLSLILASSIANAGLFGFGGSTMSWKEEVLLHDGQVIVSERFYNLGGYPTLESTEREVQDETVTFILPSTGQKIIWKTNFSDLVSEPNSLNLILFDVVKGVPFIATYPAGCIAYNKWMRPNPPQILFKYENNQCKRIALAEFPIALKKSNVIIGRPASRSLKPFYSVAQVKEQNRYVGQKYDVILREEIQNTYPGCPVLHRIDGGWASPEGAKSPIPISPRASPQ